MSRANCKGCGADLSDAEQSRVIRELRSPTWWICDDCHYSGSDKPDITKTRCKVCKDPLSKGELERNNSYKLPRGFYLCNPCAKKILSA